MTNIHREHATGFWITVVLVVVLVGYPLSLGPACWLVKKGLPERVVIVFYRPIVIAASASEEVYGALCRYIEFWAGPIEEKQVKVNI